MIRCQSVFSLFSCYSIFFKRTMRVVVYLSSAFMKEEDQTGDRQISFFFSPFILTQCKQVFTKREQKIACYIPVFLYTYIFFSLYLLFVQKLHNTISSRPIIGEDQSRIFFVSLALPFSFSLRIQAFFRLLSSTDHKSRTRKDEEEGKRRRLKRVTTGACHTSFCVMNILFFSVNIQKQ